MSFDLKKLKTVVIKIGSNLLTDGDGLRRAFFRHLRDQIVFLQENGIQVVLVSSGAIAAAMSWLKDDSRPKTISEKQAYAAIGQPQLMHVYSQVFSRVGITVAQVLLTQDGIDDPERLLNAKHTLTALLKKNVVPVVNENDTVAVDEIKIGDNDQLSAHVARMLGADLLVMLSDVEGLYNGNPKKRKQVVLVPEVTKIDKAVRSWVYNTKSARSTGGMATKLKAAEMCLEAKIPSVITSGFEKNFIKNIFDHNFVGTRFLPGKK